MSKGLRNDLGNTCKKRAGREQRVTLWRKQPRPIRYPARDPKALSGALAAPSISTESNFNRNQFHCYDIFRNRAPWDLIQLPQPSWVTYRCYSLWLRTSNPMPEPCLHKLHVTFPSTLRWILLMTYELWKTLTLQRFDTYHEYIYTLFSNTLYSRLQCRCNSCTHTDHSKHIAEPRFKKVKNRRASASTNLHHILYIVCGRVNATLAVCTFKQLLHLLKTWTYKGHQVGNRVFCSNFLCPLQKWPRFYSTHALPRQSSQPPPSVTGRNPKNTNSIMIPAS